MKRIFWGAGLLLAACCAGVSAAADLHADFIVDGGVAGAQQVEIRVLDARGEPIDGGMYDVQEGQFSGTLPLPLAADVTVRAFAFDSRGTQIAEASSAVRFDVVRSGSATLPFLDKKLQTRGVLQIAGLRIELVAERGGEDIARFEARAFDAYGKEHSIDPQTVSWEIPFPERVDFMPCKPSGGGLIPCIEFRVPAHGRPEAVFCMQSIRCRLSSSASISSGPVVYQAITAGRDHTCALLTDGRIQCWGHNDLSQAGRSTASSTCALPPPFVSGRTPCILVPLDISCPAGAPCRYVALDAGRDFTCAIDSAGDAWCWGKNRGGSFGFSCDPNMPAPGCDESALPQKVEVRSPVEKEPVPKFVQISAGAEHVCAVSRLGNLYCWGADGSAPFGTPTVRRPHLITSASFYTRVSAGARHTCAITTQGSLECWGDNANGMIVAGGQAFFLDPVDVTSGHPLLGGSVDAISAGGFDTCAHSSAGALVCWGSRITGDRLVANGPIRDLELNVRDVFTSGSQDELCAIDGGGETRCGAAPMTHDLVAMPKLATDIAVGDRHQCAVADDGTAFCFGSNNSFGQFGNNSTNSSLVPSRVHGP